METIIKQSADGIILSGDNNFDTTQGKVFINNHEITDIDTFFKVAEENTRLLEQVKKQEEVINKTIDKLRIKHNNQQKEFINFLEDNYKQTQDIWYIKILQKYKSIIGVSDEKEN